MWTHRKEGHERDARADLQAPVAEEADDLPQVLHAPDPGPPGPRRPATLLQLLPLLRAQPEALVVEVQRHEGQRCTCVAPVLIKVSSLR